MRRVDLAILSCLVLTSAGALVADQVVLKDGSVIKTAKPYVVKGSQAVLTLPDGTLVSLPASQIDGKRTAEANAPHALKPQRSSITTPQSPGEAAKMKSSRKATIVLSDEDILHPVGGGAAAAGESKGSGEGKVEVTNVQTSREGGVLMVTGSMQNTGEGDVQGVSVTVEGVGQNNKTVSTAFGRVAKDALTPGEKTTFTADFQEEASISNVRFVPRWQVKVPVKAGSEAGGAAAPAADQGAAPAPAATPQPAPAEKKPEPTYVPRPDVAAPPANAPVGSSPNPNAGYLPQPSDIIPTPAPSK